MTSSQAQSSGGPGPAIPVIVRGATTPEEVAALVAWLLSEEAAHVTGAEITVAGGWDLPRASYKSG